MPSCEPFSWKARCGTASATKARRRGHPPARLLRTALCFLILRITLSFGVGWAEQPSDARTILDQLNHVSVDPSEIYVLRDARIVRGNVNIYFNRGFIGFFSKASGEITGATFTGDGEVLLIPSDPVEKRNMARFIHTPILEERFDSAYFRFTDQTAKDLQAVARKPDPEDLEQPTGFLEGWNAVVRRLNPNYSFRALQDLLGDRSHPYFHAQFKGSNLGIFEVNVDERLIEPVEIGAVRQSQRRAYADIWYSGRSQASADSRGDSVLGPARVLSYDISTRIAEDRSLEGRAKIELESRSDLERVLVFELSRLLKVSEVTDTQDHRVEFFQNPSLEESDAAARGNDWIVVVLPSPPLTGEKYRLDFSYGGNVIADAGNGVLYVGARGSWYPNRAMADRATYQLSFEYPANLSLVATGTCVSESERGGVKKSLWISDGKLSVAGFNLGPYQSEMRRAGKTTIEVYATREAEAALEKRHVASSSARTVPETILDRRRFKDLLIPKPVPPLAPSALLGRVGEEAARAVEYFETLFGPFPYPRLAISQIPGNFGQGWPALVYLPTLSFLPRRERAELIENNNPKELTDELMLAHEIAHQWCGNLLGWRTYHDQWLSEGFASYAAALFRARQKGGERMLSEVLRGYKRDLLSKTKEGETVESGGPIWLGARLSNSLNPEGFTNIVYKKACWTLHMLRMVMRDAASGSDERFYRMLREFVAAYQNSDPSSEDFIHHAEKYMSRRANLAHNGRLDWFFSEWVYNTGIPAYQLEIETRRLNSGKFSVQGKVEQSDVTSDFVMLVPLVAHYGRDRKTRLGEVVVGEEGGRFRFIVGAKPVRVSVDEDNILAKVR